jgi:hypothetical protein
MIGQWDYRQYEKRLKAADPVEPEFEEAIKTLRERVARSLGVVVAAKSLSPHAAFRR